MLRFVYTKASRLHVRLRNLSVCTSRPHDSVVKDPIGLYQRDAIKYTRGKQPRHSELSRYASTCLVDNELNKQRSICRNLFGLLPRKRYLHKCIHTSAIRLCESNNRRHTENNKSKPTNTVEADSATAKKSSGASPTPDNSVKLDTEIPDTIQTKSWFKQKKESVLQVFAQFRKLGSESYEVMQLYWHGGARTRGQYEMIERNSKDLTQLIPFTVMAALPGAFFALPILLKVFPGFMPSVFQGKSFKAEQVMIMTQARKKSREQCHTLFTALTAEIKAIDEKTAATLQHITDMVFLTDNPNFTEDVLCDHLLQMHTCFVQHVTWNTFSHKHRRLIATHFGTPSLLTPGTNTASNLNRIVWDDLAMIKENVNTLTYEELVESSSRRGLGVVNLTQEDLRRQMRSWHRLSTKTHCDSPPLLSIASMALFHRDARRVTQIDGTANTTDTRGES